jgi:hypothetical protein
VLLCVLFLVVFVFCVCIYFRGVVVVLWLLVCFLACYCTLTCDPCATAAPMARSSTTAACALAGATDHTLSERSWEQKVLFWRTSLKGWCEDPEVDCQPMVLRGASGQVVDGGEGPAKAAAASEGGGGLIVAIAKSHPAVPVRAIRFYM